MKYMEDYTKENPLETSKKAINSIDNKEIKNKFIKTCLLRDLFLNRKK